MTVRQAISSDAFYCFENENVDDVSQKMRDWWIRRLPVVNRDKRLIGIVSLADVTARTAAPKPREVAMPSHRLRAARSAREPAVSHGQLSRHSPPGRRGYRKRIPA